MVGTTGNLRFGATGSLSKRGFHSLPVKASLALSIESDKDVVDVMNLLLLYYAKNKQKFNMLNRLKKLILRLQPEKINSQTSAAPYVTTNRCHPKVVSPRHLRFVWHH